MSITTLLFSLFCLSLAKNQQSFCDYLLGEWTQCDTISNTQNRSVECMCDQKPADSNACPRERPAAVRECPPPLVCRWKWTKWSTCSEDCEGGNTTRTQVCICSGIREPMNFSYCELSIHFGDETAECNNFECDDVPAYNKLYWIEKADEGHWPMPDGIFNCSLGYDVNGTSPKGKHYSTILRENLVSSKPHPEWYYLAKEWIAAELNVANGVDFSDSVLELISEIREVLEKCDGWTEDEIFDIYAAKDKLGRINNNIGGLEHVDDQVAVLAGVEKNSRDLKEQKSVFLMAVLIPGIGILACIAIIVGVVFYMRYRNVVQVEKLNDDSEDETSENQKNKEGGNPGEMGEKFEEEE